MSDNLFKNNFVKKYKSIKENCFETTKINLNDGPVFNFVKIFTALSDNKVPLKSENHVAYLNILVYLSKDLLQEYDNKGLFFISIYSIIKFSLWSDSKLVRTAALRCLRYYVLNVYHVELFLKMRLDFLIMRSLDLSYENAINNQYRNSDDAERIHAMRLLYRLSLISPKLFPFSLINALTVICLSGSDSSGNVLDIAIRPALLILCQLLILYPDFASKNEILYTLQTVICNQDGKAWRLNFRIIEAVLLTQLKLITHSYWRSTVPIGYFNKTLTPFSILSKIQSEPIFESGYFGNYVSTQHEFESTSISILLTLFQSWSGLLYLFGSNNKPILSLTGLLAVGCSGIRGRILDLLFQLFNIYRPPNTCTDFVSSLESITEQSTGKNRPVWNLDDEFLVGQCNDCLPHLSGNRINVIDNYQAILLGIFVQCNIFEALESAVADDNELISSRAGILLANISYKVSILLPADHPLSSKTNASVLFNNPKSQKALLWIHQVHQLLEHHQFEITPFLTYIIQQHPTINVNDYGVQSKRFLQPANIDEILDSCYLPYLGSANKPSQPSLSQQTSNKNYRIGALLDQIVRYSNIFESINEKAFYDSWDWDLLMVFGRSLVDSKPTLNIDKESLSRGSKSSWWFCVGTLNICAHYCAEIFHHIYMGDGKRHSKYLLTTFRLSRPHQKNSKINQSDTDKILFRVIQVLMKFFTLKATAANSSYSGKNLSIAKFALLPLTWKHSTNAAFVITDIICYLVESSKESEISEELNEFLIGMYSNLKDCLLSIADEKYIQEIRDNFGFNKTYEACGIFTEYDLNYKCSSYLILAIGRMSVSDIGETILEKIGFVNLFKAFLDYSRSDALTKLILGSLDYTRPSLGRSLLSIAIRSDNLWTRRYSTKFLKVLLRAKVPFFSSWGVNFLMKQLHDCDCVVKQAAYEILMEASEDEAVVNNLIIESIATLHQDFFGHILFSRLLSLPSHFDKLQNKNGVYFFLDNWKKNYNTLYCQKVDEQLMQYFTNFEIVNHNSDDPDENRISNKIKCKPRDLILLCHPYGSISEHKAGMDILYKRGDLQECLVVIMDEWNRLRDGDIQNETHTSFLKVDEHELILRSSMLAICHIARSPWGLEFIIEMNIPLIVSRLTQFHPSFNVRGTGVLCLGLLGSTRKGADVLLNYDWLTLRSDRFDKWPLLLDAFHNVQQNRSKLRRQFQSTNELGNTLKKNSMFLDEFDKVNINSEQSSAVGYSVFAAPLASDEPIKKTSFALIDDPTFILNMKKFKIYSKSIDDSIIKSRCTTVTSSSSSTHISDGDHQQKLNKFIHHKRDFSGGSASLFNINTEETSEAFTPHDVLGIATMRKLQTKFRNDLSQKNTSSVSSYYNNYNEPRCCDQMDQSLVGIFSNIRKTSSCVDKKSRKKKFSSFINPRSNLNRYRGLVLPINFNDLIMNIFKTPEERNAERSSYEKVQMWEVSNETGLSLENSIKESSVLEGKESVSLQKSRSITFEESSCVLDIALLGNESTLHYECVDKIKPTRSSSDEQNWAGKEIIFIRPRAITDIKEFEKLPKDNRHSGSIGYHVTHFRDAFLFIGDKLPKRIEQRNGLSYHSQDHCVHVYCQSEQVSEEVIEFRQKILKSVSLMLTISSKTKKTEMNLARLKSGQNQLFWIDPCLFSEICILMSLYSFSRLSRQYIQELFLSVPMNQLQDDMKLCLEEFSKENKSKSSFSTRL